MLSLQQLMRHPEQVDAEALRFLHDEVGKYPYFHAVRLLYVRGLYQSQSDDFGNELRRAAIAIPDRTALFELIEGPNMRPARTLRHTTPKPVPSEEHDRTQTLIETFLASKPDPTRSSRQRPVDASSDYIAYLMQQEPETLTPDVTSTETPSETPAQTHSKALSETPSETVPKTTSVNVAPTPPSETQKEDEDAFLTETLARIYIKQGKYHRAIENIRRISLRNPKKNRYFADQIRFLEKLIANEQAKTEEISNK